MPLIRPQENSRRVAIGALLAVHIPKNMSTRPPTLLRKIFFIAHAWGALLNVSLSGGHQSSHGAELQVLMSKKTGRNLFIVLLRAPAVRLSKRCRLKPLSLG